MTDEGSDCKQCASLHFQMADCYNNKDIWDSLFLLILLKTAQAQNRLVAMRYVSCRLNITSATIFKL
jgi:hypothetical protein